MDKLILIGHTATTLAMAGVMWTVQLVVYPQFQSVHPDNLSNYVAQHGSRIVAVLILFAPLEVLFSLGLWVRGAEGFGLPSWATLLAGMVLVVAWVSTGLYFGPFHGRFQTGPYDPSEISLLISTNWLRTLFWTVRAGFALWFLNRVIS